MITTCAEMREAEKRAFSSGIAEEQLMEQAGLGVARVIMQYFPSPSRARVYFGRGHNGGDALVAARHLKEHGWEVDLAAGGASARLTPLTEKMVAAFYSANGRVQATGGLAAIIDGVLGTGTKGEPVGVPAEAISEINDLREATAARTFAIDLPSGLNGDTGTHGPTIVRADCTVAIGGVKRGLLADEATDSVGRLALVSLSGVALPEADRVIALPEALGHLLGCRRFDSHKGDYGRVAIVAGSEGLTGAALLTAAGALRVGAGLVTLCVPRAIYPQLAAAAGSSIPEGMVRPVEHLMEALDVPHDVLAIGPGLGSGCRDEILETLARESAPAVVDADALNALAAAGLTALERSAGPRLLTPHPGEMVRLFDRDGSDRTEWARRFVRKYPVALLLKGARSIVAEKGKPLSYNTTGTPALASGGVGDVLTGVCAGLVAQGLVAYDAARLGVWLLGRAAEIAVREMESAEEALLPGDIASYLGGALLDLRRGCY
jgi:NAD(P)H-hydrate epimerase